MPPYHTHPIGVNIPSFNVSDALLTLWFASKLPGSFNDFVMQHSGGKLASDALQTHCRREIMQAVWKTLLDDDFLEAWRNGIVVHCGDGVTRRLYPRIFTYSADYPEK